MVCMTSRLVRVPVADVRLPRGSDSSAIQLPVAANSKLSSLLVIVVACSPPGTRSILASSAPKLRSPSAKSPAFTDIGGKLRGSTVEGPSSPVSSPGRRSRSISRTIARPESKSYGTKSEPAISSPSSCTSQSFALRSTRTLCPWRCCPTA